MRFQVPNRAFLTQGTCSSPLSHLPDRLSLLKIKIFLKILLIQHLAQDPKSQETSESEINSNLEITGEGGCSAIRLLLLCTEIMLVSSGDHIWC